MLVIEQCVLKSKQALSLLTNSSGAFGLFSLVSVAELLLHRLFNSTERDSACIGILGGLLSSLIILIAMVCLVARWRSITYIKQTDLLLIISFLLMS
jgi:hypothetical protein